MKISDSKLKWIGTAGVFLAVLVFFLPVLRGDFLSWDDTELLVRNSYYCGLNLSHWQWMCTTFHFGHWQPLSWVSYALDYKMWGMNPQGWHATNLMLHSVNAALVYLLCLSFLKEKRRRYAVAVLAALFWAVHPLRVEVAAWLSTRGYLLCTAFCLLTVLFYLRAAEQKRYPLIALFFFVLATFTKGIGMMIPPILLLIDGVPLRRINSMRAAVACTVEKIPFFVLSLVTGVTAFLAKRADGGMAPLELYGPVQRIGQAIYGIWFYLLKIVSPHHLSPLYGKQPEIWQVLSALILSIGAGIFLFLFRRKVFSIIETFGAFLLLIFPMLGFTQSGVQLFADRFTYLAAVPFSILLGAGLARLTAMRRTVYGATATLLVVFGLQTFSYSTLWCDDLSLWRYAIAQDEKNAQAYGNMGSALVSRREYKNAIEYLNKALFLQPVYAYALQNRAVARLWTGKYEEALADVNKALSLETKDRISRAKMLIGRGQIEENLNHPEQALADYSTVIDDLTVTPFWKALALQERARLHLERGSVVSCEADLEAILKLPDPNGERWSRIRPVLAEIKKIPED